MARPLAVIGITYFLALLVANTVGNPASAVVSALLFLFFILALFFLAGHNDLWMIFLVSAVRSVGAGIQTPAVNALLPQIVPQEKLIRIGGINGSLQSVMFLLSPAAAGAVLSIATIEATFFIDVTTAAAAIVIMVILKVPLHKKALEKQKGGYFDDLKAGLKYVLGSGFFRAYFIFFALFMFCVVPASQLTPLMVARTFGDDVWRLSVTEVAFSVGSVVGGIAISAWGGFRNRMHTVSLACILFGALTALLGIMANFPVFLIVMGVTGLSMPLFTTPSMVLLQEQVNQDMQGRVFSLVQIVMTAMVPLGMVFFGPLADRIPIQTLFIVTGVVMAVLGAGILWNRHFKTGLISD